MLPRCIELGLLNFLTSQLDRELISYNVMVSDLEKRAREVFSKSCDMLEVIEGLRQDKAALKVRLLGQLEEQKKASDDIFELQERVDSGELEITSLRVQINQECAGDWS